MLSVMRHTSLKTQKSPPTSPGSKKIVRFADSLGKDLAAVKTIMQEDLPLIPASAFDHLDLPAEVLNEIRSHILAAANNSNNSSPVNGSPKPSPVSSPSSHHRIFNGYHRQTGSSKPFLPKYPIPFRCGSSTFINSLSGSLDQLHLDLDDDLLDQCPRVKAPTALPFAPVRRPLMMSKKPLQDPGKTVPLWHSMQNQPATLIPEFTEPFVQMNFLDRVKASSVCLENCYISNNYSASRTAGPLTAAPAFSDINSPAVNATASPPAGGGISVTTCIRVVNRAYEKEIYCRFTTDEWKTWKEEKAVFIPTSSDSWSDRFTATFHVSNLNPGQRVRFAIRYVTDGQEFWDNNNGNNYSLMYRI